MMNCLPEPPSDNYRNVSKEYNDSELLSELPEVREEFNEENSEENITISDEEIYGFIQKVQDNSDEFLMYKDEVRLFRSNAESEYNILKLSCIEEEMSTLRVTSDSEYEELETEGSTLDEDEVNEAHSNPNTAGISQECVETNKIQSESKQNDNEFLEATNFIAYDEDIDKLENKSDDVSNTELMQENESTAESAIKSNIRETETAEPSKLMTASKDISKSDVLSDSLDLFRRDDETFSLRRKRTEILELVTNSQIINERLKQKQVQLLEDLASYKSKLFETLQETKICIRLTYEVEDRIAILRKTIEQLSEEVEQLRMELTEKIIIANKARRELTENEIGLTHISKAYENKRKEARKLSKNIKGTDSILVDVKEKWRKLVCSIENSLSK